jgi:L-lactate dehydrogenase complex protein LldG
VTPRDEVLGRIRRANSAAGAGDGGRVAPPSAEAGYRAAGDRDQAELLDLLADRLVDYRATVRRTTADRLAGEVAAALAHRDARRVVVPAGLDVFGPGGPPDGLEVITDDGLHALVPAGGADGPVSGTVAGSVSGSVSGSVAGSVAGSAKGDAPEAVVPDTGVLDSCDGAITGAAVAIAETGTIVLDAGPDQGRRAITLVPDYHLCIVHADQVVELVPEGVERLAGASGRPLTWISGPSATSDIELNRVEGVHGPRTLEVILVEP